VVEGLALVWVCAGVWVELSAFGAVVEFGCCGVPA
jgi:hypothetical protein